MFLRYSVSLLGYGFYGDVLTDSERKRWMGPARYDLSGSDYICFFLKARPSSCLNHSNESEHCTAGKIAGTFQMYRRISQVWRCSWLIITMREWCPTCPPGTSWERPETLPGVAPGKGQTDVSIFLWSSVAGGNRWQICFVFFFLSRCAVCQHNGEKLSETAESYKMDEAFDSGEWSQTSLDKSLRFLVQLWN